MTDETARAGKLDEVLEHDAEAIEHMRAHVRTYMVVFAALAAFTVITVAVAYLHLPHAIGVPVALLIAAIKGGLVASYFMHLIDERKAIYSILLLTAVFFVAVMFLPLGQHENPGPNAKASFMEPMSLESLQAAE